jgi:hypothetical protein
MRSAELEDVCQRAAAREAQAEEKSRALLAAREAWDRYLAGEAWWLVLFAWIRPVKGRRDAGRRLVLRSHADLMGGAAGTDAEAIGNLLATLFAAKRLGSEDDVDAVVERVAATRAQLAGTEVPA